MARIDTIGTSLFSTQLRLILPQRSSVQRSSAGSFQRTLGLRSLDDQLRNLRVQLEKIAEGADVSSARRPSKARAAHAISAAPLDLDAVATPTTLRSVEEVNTTPTSFTAFGPDWGGLGISSAQAAIGGTYLGTNGSGTLDFQVHKEGTHGDNDLEIDVLDPSDSFIERIKIKKNDPIDKLYTLTNGLTLQLGAGDLLELDEFHVDVDASLPTSFSPSSPIWDGLVSNAEATIGGVYDGSDGTGTFTFEVRREGIHGEDDLQVRVLQPGGGTLQTLRIDKEDPLDQVYLLDNGLTFTLGAGELIKDDTFTLEVFDTVGSAVDPSKPFDGVRNEDPNLESGLNVTAGSFEVNGVSISVAANDTIDAVLAKITASAAGVSAAFDAASETIVLTQQGPGSGPTITLTNDTSGFLDATKLSAAAPVAGQDGEDRLGDPMATVPSLSSVTDGTFTVNEVGISIDVDVDSLADVIDRINVSAAGVRATYDPYHRRLSIVSQDTTKNVVLSDAETGFLGAVNIAPGTYAPSKATQGRRASPRLADAVSSLLRELPRHLGSLLRDPFPGIGRDELTEIRKDLRQATEQSFAAFLGKPSTSILRSGFGIDFDFGRNDGRTIDFDRRKVERSLRSDPESLRAFLFQDESESERGLVPSLLGAVRSLQSHVANALGRPDDRGSLIDLLA